MSEFSERVISIVNQIPCGQVVSYGQVAAYVGVPRGARQVGNILRTHDEAGMPWWRVINNAGRISIKNMFHGADEQRDRLQKEGVAVSRDFIINIEKYRWQATEAQMKSWGVLWVKFKRAF